MKPTLLLALLVPSALSAACFVEVQSLSSSMQQADSGTVFVDPPEPPPNTYKCGWERDFYKLIGNSGPRTYARIQYDRTGQVRAASYLKPSGSNRGPQVERLLSVGPNYVAVNTVDDTGYSTIDLVDPANNTPVTTTTWPSYLSAGRRTFSARHGDVQYLLSDPVQNTQFNVVNNYISLFAIDLRKGVPLEAQTIRFEGAPFEWTDNNPLYKFSWAGEFGDFNSKQRGLWFDEGVADAQLALYLQQGQDLWRVNLGDSIPVGRKIFRGSNLPITTFITPGTTDVYWLEMMGATGEYRLHHSNQQSSPPQDDILAVYSGGAGAIPGSNGAPIALVYDAPRSRFLLQTNHAILALPRSGGSFTELYKREYDASRGMLSSTLRLNGAGTEAYFDENCAGASAAESIQYGPRAMNLATGNVEWLWERQGFPLLEGNFSVEHNGKFAYRVMSPDGER